MLLSENASFTVRFIQGYTKPALYVPGSNKLFGGKYLCVVCFDADAAAMCICTATAICTEIVAAAALGSAAGGKPAPA